jgi:hypothetical protein
MARIKLSTAWKHAGIATVFMLSAACSAPADTNAFLIRSEAVDLRAVTDQVIHALVSEFASGGRLQAGYPAVGHVATAPDPSDPDVERMTCADGSSDDPDVASCILLSRAGDFMRVLPITWPSAAFHMYRIYVSPRSLFAKVDPVRDFVAIDVYLLQAPGLGEAVDRAIRDAIDHLGARPFRP